MPCCCSRDFELKSAAYLTHPTTPQVQEQFVRELGGKEYPITKADAFQLRRAGGCSTTLSSTK
jgi:hypothetical protein